MDRCDVTECRAQAQEPPGIQNGGTIDTKGRSQCVTLETLRDVLDFACQVGNPLQHYTGEEPDVHLKNGILEIIVYFILCMCIFCLLVTEGAKSWLKMFIKQPVGCFFFSASSLALGSSIHKTSVYNSYVPELPVETPKMVYLQISEEWPSGSHFNSS